MILMLLPLQMYSLVYVMDRWQSGLGAGKSADPLKGTWHPVTGSALPLLMMTLGLIAFGCWPGEPPARAGQAPPDHGPRLTSITFARLTRVRGAFCPDRPKATDGRGVVTTAEHACGPPGDCGEPRGPPSGSPLAERRQYGNRPDLYAGIGGKHQPKLVRERRSVRHQADRRRGRDQRTPHLRDFQPSDKRADRPAVDCPGRVVRQSRAHLAHVPVQHRGKEAVIAVNYCASAENQRWHPVAEHMGIGERGIGRINPFAGDPARVPALEGRTPPDRRAAPRGGAGLDTYPDEPSAYAPPDA